MNPFLPTLRLTAIGAAPADLAWERYALPDLWPTWSPHLRSVEADGLRLEPGMTGTVHGPVGVSARFTVLKVDEEEMRWSWRVHRGPVSALLEHGVEANDAGCRTWLALKAPAPLAVGYLPFAAIALHKLVTPAATTL